MPGPGLLVKTRKPDRCGAVGWFVYVYLKLLDQFLFRQLVFGGDWDAMADEQLAAGLVHRIADENASELGGHVILEHRKPVRMITRSRPVLMS